MKKILKFPIFILAFAMAIMSAFAFNTKPVTKVFSTSYHYVGAYTNAEVKKPANWVAESSSCPPSGNLPCSILTNLSRANFDLMVQGFSNVAAATAASTTKAFQ
jgi:hypothetical protein